MSRSWSDYLVDLSLALIPIGAAYFAINRTMNNAFEQRHDAMAPDQTTTAHERSMRNKRILEVMWEKSGKEGPLPTIDEYEEIVLADAVFPFELKTSLDDIGKIVLYHILIILFYCYDQCCYN